MARQPNRKGGRFRIYESQRSGFEYGFQPITSPPNNYTRESGKPVLDNGIEVAPSEFDSPPPSKKSLGGADIGSGARSDSNFDTPSDVYVIPPESVKLIIYVNSSTSIAWNTRPIVYVVGSNASQVMAVNPQLIRGQQGQQISLECVGSSITLLNGSGITVDFNKNRVLMESGGIANFLYNATDSTWHMTSFNANGGL